MDTVPTGHWCNETVTGLNRRKTGDAERECIMYAAVGRTNIFYTVTGAGLPCLVPSLAGTPIYELTFTPALKAPFI